MSTPISTYQFFYREDNDFALEWIEKIRIWAGEQYPNATEQENAEVIIVLGGDGTILEAARNFHDKSSMIFGLNLGTVGFIASVREPKDFITGLDKLFSGNYESHDRMMLKADVYREGNEVFSAIAMNDIVVQNLLGMVELEVGVSGHPFQVIRGSGVLVSTATGSTAYNLSAHGPVLMPNIKGMIVTELLDHNIPTPSLVIKHDRKIEIEVTSFRERGVLTLTETGKPVDVLLLADTETTFPLKEKDRIIITKSPHLVTFAEVEESYFFKSLEEKFAF